MTAVAGVVLLTAPFVPSAAWYYAGRTNRDMFTVFNLNHLLLSFLAAAVGFAVLVGLTVVLLNQRAFRRAACTVLLLLLGAVVVFFRPNLVPPNVYDLGFAKWVQQHVSQAMVEDVARWHNKLPPTTQTTLLPLHLDEPAFPGESASTDWPASIRQLAPERVIPMRDGIILQWECFGTWGSSRRIIITNTSNKPDDRSYHYDYQPARPNVWFAVQDQN